jgi:hypothetical protein
MNRRLFLKFVAGIPFLGSWMNFSQVSANLIDSGFDAFPPSIPGQTITITSGKRGVGKTSIIGNLGVCLNQAGYRVLVIDTTQFEGFSTVFGMNHNVAVQRPCFKLPLEAVKVEQNFPFSALL